MRTYISSIVVLTASAGVMHAATADFQTFTPGSYPSVTVNGVTATATRLGAPANIGVGSAAGQTGLGVVGGTFLPTANNTLDLDETLTLDYGLPVNGVTALIHDIDPPGNVTYGFNAFLAGTDLGFFAVPLHTALVETKDLTGLAGGLVFDKVTFSVSASAPAGLQILSTSFSAVPEPASLSLLAAPMLMLRRRRA